MAKGPKDDTLYCEQCGISFLWSIEEQMEAATKPSAKPTRCSGCRHSLPADGRERGLVKWYSVRKKYGFIVRAEQPEIFAHRREVKGSVRLREGDLVEFGVEESAKGPIATQIRLIDRQLRS